MNKKGIIILIIIVLLAVLGFIYYYNSNNQTSPNTASSHYFKPNQKKQGASRGTHRDAYRSKLNRGNYNKIRNGMSKSDVYDILGEPYELADKKMAKSFGEVGTWKEGGVTITIIFVDGKVYNKNYRVK